jgi:heme/copper-type cytochrome/quinol oxidase subunit 2
MNKASTVLKTEDLFYYPQPLPSSSMQTSSNTLLFLAKLKTALRILLRTTIVCLLITAALVLVFGTQQQASIHEWISGFIYLSIVGGLWLVVLASIAIAIVGFVSSANDQPVWPAVKQEIILTLMAIASYIVVFACVFFKL